MSATMRSNTGRTSLRNKKFTAHSKELNFFAAVNRKPIYKEIAMRTIFSFVVFAFSISLVSCVSVDYVKTGKEYDPLPSDTEVKLLLASFPETRFEEIGTVRVSGGSEEVQIDRAKQIARQKGGQGIMPKKKGGDSAELPEDTVEFRVVRLTGRADDKGGEPKKELINPALESIDYSKLEEAAYEQLLEDDKSLKEETFKGSFLPKKTLKIPAELKKYCKEKEKIVVISADGPEEKLLLIVPRDTVKQIRSLIKKKQKVNIVYSPVGVYKKKNDMYPVLKFIDMLEK